jgi:hypothetical protein
MLLEIVKVGLIFLLIVECKTKGVNTMKRWTVRIVIAVALLLTGYFAGHRSQTVVYAQQAVNVPKTWGRCVGTMERGVVFEDSTGTIRIVDSVNGHLNATVNRN